VPVRILAAQGHVTCVAPAAGDVGSPDTFPAALTRERGSGGIALRRRSLTRRGRHRGDDALDDGHDALGRFHTAPDPSGRR